MSELPKSIVLNGYRYPTWTLSVRAREQLANLHRVDAYIEELNDRLSFYTSARDLCQRHLLDALPKSSLPAQRSYWQTAPLEWARAEWPPRSSSLRLRLLGDAIHYREGDQVLIYVKGHGVVGWGQVETEALSTMRCLVWRFRVATLKDALSAKALRGLGLRHPNRASQLLPTPSGVPALLTALEKRPAFTP